MKNILGYFGDVHGNPVSYMDNNGLIIFSSKKSLKKTKLLGSYSEMNRILSNIDYYTLRQYKQHKQHKQHKQKGAGGLFGESDGSCGWGSNPSCCFFSCEPMWRTSLWPISDATM